jgi:hypothetical protein
MSTLHSLGASPDTNAQPAIKQGNATLKNAASAISWAQSQGASINSAAQSLATAAQNYATAHCG